MNELRKIVVIGTSMGGLSALKELLGNLKEQPAAAFFIVHHVSDTQPAVLHKILSNYTTMECKLSEHGEEIQPGKIYTSPSNKHLIIDGSKIVHGDGVRESGARPSVNILFKSAAVSYGEKVIGIVLTGLLSDGSKGVQVIGQHGGTIIVQDPDEAEYKDMPTNAIRMMEDGFILPLKKIGDMIDVLMNQIKSKKKTEVDPSITRLLDFARKQGSEGNSKNLPGTTQYTVDESLYNILLLMQERTNMLENLAEEYKLKGSNYLAGRYAQRAKESGAHSKNLREHMDFLSVKAS